MGRVIRFVLVVLLAVGLPATHSLTAAELSGAHWEVVAIEGPLFFVYVHPDKVKDKTVYAAAVETVAGAVGGRGPFQIDFFDDREHTPKTRTYTPENREHPKARYNYNPKNGMSRFGWIVWDAEGSEGKPTLLVDELSLPTKDSTDE